MDIEQLLLAALENMKGDTDKAAQMVMGWSAQDSSVREVVEKFTRELIAGYLLDLKARKGNI